MSSVEHALARGTRRAESITRELGAEIRRARTEHGLSQTVVARAARISRSQLSRIERGEAPRMSILVVSRALAVLGLELSARAYPAGQPIRDVAHRALLDRLRAKLGPGLRWRYERPVGEAGDLRAWDATVEAGAIRVGVEAETRAGDIQALQRRIALKSRDDPDAHYAILLLSNTRHNRSVLRENFEALGADFLIGADEALAAIAAGRSPGGNTILLL